MSWNLYKGLVSSSFSLVHFSWRERKWGTFMVKKECAATGKCLRRVSEHSVHLLSRFSKPFRCKYSSFVLVLQEGSCTFHTFFIWCSPLSFWGLTDFHSFSRLYRALIRSLEQPKKTFVILVPKMVDFGLDLELGMTIDVGLELLFREKEWGRRWWCGVGSSQTPRLTVVGHKCL